jgi:hypothetical protein
MSGIDHPRGFRVLASEQTEREGDWVTAVQAAQKKYHHARVDPL